MPLDGTSEIPALAALSPDARVEASRDQEGISVLLGARDVADRVTVSNVWDIAGWTVQFVRLASEQKLGLDQAAGNVYLKVIAGELADVGLGPFAPHGKARDTRISNSTIQAGGEGALLVVFTETPAVAPALRSMDQLRFGGPFAETLRWTSFEKKFGRATSLFDGLDAHICPGFRVFDGDGSQIVYLHFWTAGKGVDCSTHDHSEDPEIVGPPFAEIHWVFQNGTGKGGMYTCEAVGATHRRILSLQRGQEHGPFWSVESLTGLPKRLDNGALEYGLHGWQAGLDEFPEQAYDFVAAFEFDPDHARITS